MLERDENDKKWKLFFADDSFGMMTSTNDHNFIKLQEFEINVC